MTNIEDRVGKLEKTFARITGGLAVALIFVFGFFGYAHWYQIPEEVGTVLPKAVERYVEKENSQFRNNILKIKSDAKRAEEVLAHAKLELEKLLDQSRSFDKTNQSISNRERKMELILKQMSERLSDLDSRKISSVEFWDSCNLARVGNLCDISAPSWPDGYSSVHEWWDSWMEGRCGNGNKCRLCVRYSN